MSAHDWYELISQMYYERVTSYMMLWYTHMYGIELHDRAQAEA